MENKKFWQGTNFWFAAIMFILSFVGGSEQLGMQIASVVVGIIGSAGTLRQFLPNAKFRGIKATLGEVNTWNYLTASSLLILPQAGELIPALRGLYDALIMSNWGLVITRGVTLLTIVFYLVKKK